MYILVCFVIQKMTETKKFEKRIKEKKLNKKAFPCSHVLRDACDICKYAFSW